ncbi:hypothetical protein AB5J72_41460 [Streptomyces sp. CG1]|uniref:hypothetical protein n=1 Tax=Streptomyces sp. CG1 TaxID=1287523 RepID=UPI0034E1BC61
MNDPDVAVWLDLCDPHSADFAMISVLPHGLLDHIVDGHFAAVRDLDDRIEAVEDLLFDEGRAQMDSVQRDSYALRKIRMSTPKPASSLPPVSWSSHPRCSTESSSARTGSDPLPQ